MADGDNNVFIETSSCVLIAVPLGGASGCAIVTGVPSIVTTGWTSIALTNEIEAGTDYSQKGANGKQCGPRLVGDDVIKWKNVAGTLCVKNLALFSMLSGDPVVVDANDHIVGIEHLIGGASASGSVCDAASNKPKVAMFIGRKASDSDGGCGASASTSGMTGLNGHFLPLLTDFVFEDETFEDARQAYSFTAKAYANPLIGRGPWNLWPTTAVPTAIHAQSAHSEMLIAAGGVPAPSANPIVHPTVVAPL